VSVGVWNGAGRRGQKDQVNVRRDGDVGFILEFAVYLGEGRESGVGEGSRAMVNVRGDVMSESVMVSESQGLGKFHRRSERSVHVRLRAGAIVGTHHFSCCACL
jgi:hypothetical protein